MTRTLFAFDGRMSARLLPFVVLAALSACRPQRTSADAAPADLAIAHVSVVDVESGRILPDRTVLIAGSRIVQVAPASGARIPAGSKVVDATGKYLIPGLWDAHVHPSLAGPGALPLFVAWGVTSVRDAGSRLDDAMRMRARIRAREIVGPRIMISGPVLEGAAWMKAAYEIAPPEHPIWAGATRIITSKENARHVVDSLRALGVDLIKSRNVWGEDFLALADAAERAGIPLASHNPNRVNMFDAARRGLDSFEHAESIWGDFDTMAVAERERMFGRVAETRAFVVPTLMADIGLVVSSDSVVLAAIADTLGRLDARNRSLPREMRALWESAMEQRRKYGGHPDGTFAKIARDVRAMHAAGIPMLAGTDAGAIPLVYPGSSLHEELELLVREGGLSPLEALRTATRNPPRFFGMQDTLGTIAAGRIADLVLLDADPIADIGATRSIAGVVLDGRHLDRAALRQLIADAERPLRR